MTIQIMSKLRRVILMAAFIAIISLFFNCKKSSSSVTSTNTTWSFTCEVDSIEINISGTGLMGEVSSVSDTYTGGSEVGSLGVGPGIFINYAGNCNTSATNPCLGFLADFQFLKQENYAMSDTTTLLTANGEFAINQMLITLPSNSSLSYTTYSQVSAPNPVTNLTFDILTVGSPGGSITGRFNGTILKVVTTNNGITDIYTTKSVKINGTFTVYRES